jgi:hypothetical protein
VYYFRLKEVYLPELHNVKQEEKGWNKIQKVKVKEGKILKKVFILI